MLKAVSLLIFTTLYSIAYASDYHCDISKDGSLVQELSISGPAHARAFLVGCKVEYKNCIAVHVEGIYSSFNTQTGENDAKVSIIEAANINLWTSASPENLKVQKILTWKNGEITNLEYENISVNCSKL